MELKHIVGYLPYGLKLECRNFGSEKKTFIVDFLGINKCDIIISNPYGGIDYSEFEDIYPIVRPLSDLTKEIEVNGEKFVPSKWFKENYYSDLYHGKWFKNKTNWGNINHILPYHVIQKLFEWHFDVHGLIEKGKAIDINNISNGKL